MNINNLPLYCLESIFDQFSLQELISMRSVCVEWLNVINNICTKKRSLILCESMWYIINYEKIIHFYTSIINFKKDNEHIFYKKKDFLVNPSKMECLNYDTKICKPDHFYSDLFPKLSRLIICSEKHSKFKIDLSIFLQQWSHNLTSLTLIGSHICCLSVSILPKLWDSINSLSSLTELHLLKIGTFPKRLPVLSQLERFTLVIDPEKRDHNIMHELSKYNSKLRFLTFNGLANFNFVPFFFDIDAHLKNNLTHLNIGYIIYSKTRYIDHNDEEITNHRNIYLKKEKILQLICTTFVNLNHLNADFAHGVSMIFKLKLFFY